MKNIINLFTSPCLIAFIALILSIPFGVNNFYSQSGAIFYVVIIYTLFYKQKMTMKFLFLFAISYAIFFNIINLAYHPNILENPFSLLTDCLLISLITFAGTYIINRLHSIVINKRIITISCLFLLITVVYFLFMSIFSDIKYTDEQKLTACLTLLNRESNYFPSDIDNYTNKVFKSKINTNKEELNICENILKDRDSSSPVKIFDLPLRSDVSKDVERITKTLTTDTNNSLKSKVIEIPFNININDFFYPFLLKNGKLLLYSSNSNTVLLNPDTKKFKPVIDKRSQLKSGTFETFYLPDNQVYIEGYTYDPTKNILYSDNKQANKINKVIQQLIKNKMDPTYLSNMRFLVASGDRQFVSYSTQSTGYQYLSMIDLLSKKAYPKVKLNIPRSGFSVAELKDGQILIIGGYYYKKMYDLIPVDTIELYNPKQNSIKIVGKIRLPVYHSSVVLKDGRVLIIENDENSSLLEIFDPKTQKVNLLADLTILKSGRFRDAKLLPDTGQVFILYYNAFVVDPEKETITLLNNSRLRYDDLLFTPMGNNKIFLMGGKLESGYICDRRILKQADNPAILDLPIK